MNIVNTISMFQFKNTLGTDIPIPMCPNCQTVHSSLYLLPTATIDYYM